MTQLTVRQARRLAEKTQEEVAAAIGVDRSTYIKYEENPARMSVGKALLMCDYLGQTIDNISFT